MSSPNDKYRSFLDPTEPPGTAEDFLTTVATDVDDDFMFTRGMQVLLGSILLLPGLGLTFLMALFARTMEVVRKPYARPNLEGVSAAICKTMLTTLRVAQKFSQTLRSSLTARSKRLMIRLATST